MIGRLLTLARLDTSTVPVEMTAVNLTELVHQIVDDARFEAQKRNVTVITAAPEHCYARGNAELVHSAIENIVRNAIRYTEIATSVDVLLEPDDNSNVLLVIRDHGKGVPENDLERIFQPFYRVAEARRLSLFPRRSTCLRHRSRFRRESSRCLHDEPGTGGI